SGALAVGGGEDDPPGRAQQDLLQRVGEVGEGDGVVAATGGQQGGLVGEVGQVGADHARRGRGDHAQIDVVGQGHGTGVNLQDLAPSLAIGRLDPDPAVKASGA